MTHEPSASTAPRRHLTLLDSTSIIVGIVVGSGLYESTPRVAANLPNSSALLAVWLVGGLIALVGALCYAELATTYPQEGGDYVYLSRAFGTRMGFLFSWAQLWVVRPGSIGALAFVFAKYANELAPLSENHFPLVVYAAAAIVALSILNALGVREGKWAQNLLTAAKVLGLTAIFAVALLGPGSAASTADAATASGGLRLAMILVMFTYGGWNDMSYVAAEVRDPRRNLVRALLLGTLLIMALYLVANVAFVHVLGFKGLQQSSAVASQMLEARIGAAGGRLISALVCISCLGAINGMLFTGSRIYYAWGTGHRWFSWLGVWSPTLGTPVRALAVQGVITLATVVGFGLHQDGFERMVVFTTPAYWFFVVMTAISLFVLRRNDPATPRPFSVPWFPVTPLVFCVSSLFMLYAAIEHSVTHRSAEASWAVGLLMVGVLISLLEPASKTDR